MRLVEKLDWKGLKGLHSADVAEIQEAVTDKLKKVQKSNFQQLFRNCTITQKPVYIPIGLILNKKGVFLSCLRFLKKPVLKLLDRTVLIYILPRKWNMSIASVVGRLICIAYLRQSICQPVI
jgi:hypothetical protein